MLITGSIPTENLPTRSHDTTKTTGRRTLTRVILEVPENTSCSSSVPGIPVVSIEDLRMQLDETTIAPWTVDKIDEQDCVRFKLYDQVHSVAKYTVSRHVRPYGVGSN